MKNLQCYLLAITLSFIAYKGDAQLKVGNNPTTIGASSLLELESTTKGLVLPRMTTAQVSAIASPVKGMQVFNTDSNCIAAYNGAAWQLHCSTGGPATPIEPWYNVATGTGATSNTQNIYQTGNVGIGTQITSFKFNVLGGASQFGQTSAGAGIRLQTTGSNGDIAGINHANNAFNALSFTTGGTPTMYITTAGDVGIGISPGAGKLDVRTATAAQSGIYSQSTTGSAVYAASTTGIAVNAQSSAGGIGVYGSTTTAQGVYGIATSTGSGVYGVGISGFGVYGQSTTGSGGYFSSSNNVGGSYALVGYNSATGTAGGAFLAQTSNGKYLAGPYNNAAYGGVSNGDFAVIGTLTKTAGTFKIDHPQDPANKFLVHSFVESPDMMNVYNGNITTDANGDAVIKLPDYFYSLNKDFRYQLTVIGSFAQTMIATEISAKNTFTIKSDKPNVKVSWQVTGIRQDEYANAHRIVDVVDKTGDEKGKYLHPELFGQSKEKGFFYKAPVIKDVSDTEKK